MIFVSPENGCLFFVFRGRCYHYNELRQLLRKRSRGDEDIHMACKYNVSCIIIMYNDSSTWAQTR